MTDTEPANGSLATQARQAEHNRLLVHLHQLETLIIYSGMAEESDEVLAVAEDKLERLLLVVRNRKGDA